MLATLSANGDAAVASPTASSILWIDDDDRGTDITARVLVAEGFDVDTATTGTKGLLLAMSRPYALIVLDLRLPDMSGIDVLRALRLVGLKTPTALVTGFATVAMTVEAMKFGAVDVIEKPLLADDLANLARRVGLSAQCRQENPLAQPLETPAMFKSVAKLLMSQPQLSLEETARRLRLDRHAIERGVLIYTGRCFREWRRGFEMQRAAQILRMSDVPIKAIAYELGYTSQRAFAPAFSAVNGMSPSHYRERHRVTLNDNRG